MDTLSYLMGKKSGSGSSGTIIDSLSITDNGHYVAPAGHAYNPVHVEMLKPTGDILLTDNGSNIDIAQYATATVNVQGGAPVSVPKKDVIFFDYDGTVLYSYTADEFKTLNTLPANPIHTGLTAQGWNWSLSDAKALVNLIGKCNIGQTYTTSDGKTRLYINISENAPEYARTFELKFKISNGSVTVNYGDGSDFITVTTSDVSLTHNYVNTGNYVITLTINSGSISFNTQIFNDSDLNANRRLWLQRIEIGNNVTSIGNYAFSRCYALQDITIPNNVTNIGTNAFSNCIVLQNVIIPTGLVTIGSYTFDNCRSLQNVVIPCTTTNIENSAFNNCTILYNIIIPNSIINIKLYAFNGCTTLQSVIIPNNVTSIGSNAFNACFSLREVYFTPTTPPTVSNSSAWQNVQTSCIIYIPFVSSIEYLTATNYPSTSTYTYIGYATYADGANLPSQDSSQRCNVRWYPTIMDAINQTNQIAVGNGNKIYCRYV